MPTLVSHAKARKIDVINNSWASNFEITDLSKSENDLQSGKNRLVNFGLTISF